MDIKRKSPQFAIIASRQWATKAVETLLGNDTFRYLSICSISFACSVNSLIPPAPPIQCCVGAVVCAVKEIEKSTLFWGKGGNVTKMLKNSILLQSVSTLLSPIVALKNIRDLQSGNMSEISMGGTQVTYLLDSRSYGSA